MSTHRTLLATSAALLSALMLSACGMTPIVSAPESISESPSESPPEQAPPADASDFNQTDVMYAQMMIPHHEQAIEMSDIIIDTEGVSAETVAIAQQIKAAQEPEIEQLDGLLESWGFESMAGRGMRGHGMGGIGMGGMLSEQELEAIENATGAEAERLFLEGMIEHHEGAIDMSEPVLTNGESPELIALAGEIIDAQLIEIETMTELLARL